MKFIRRLGQFVFCLIWAMMVLPSFAQVPTLSAVTPNTGPDTGGTMITLTGTNFATGASVALGGIVLPCNLVSASTITCTDHAGTPGIKSVVVTQPGGTATMTNAFTYTTLTLTSVTPSAGPDVQRTSITLTGTNLDAAGAFGTVVTLGGVPLSCAVVSATTMTCTAPPGPVGSQSLVVTQPGGRTATLTNAFTYTTLTLTSVTPNAGPDSGGTTLTLTGTSFDETSGIISPNVYLGYNHMPCTLVSASSLTCTAPAGPIGAQDIYISQMNGRSTTLTNAYTYTPTTTLTSVTPNVSSSPGGTPITLTGTNFSTGLKVMFNYVELTGCAVVSSTTITCNSPATLWQQAGPVEVEVVRADGRLAASLANGFTFVAPVLTSITPNVGPDTGATAITLTGTGFATGATVTIGGVATTCTVVSPTTMTCLTPAGSVGAVGVGIDMGLFLTAYSPSAFTYTPSLTLTSVTPNVGPVTAGATVTLTGTNFAAGATVSLGGMPITDCTVVSATSITCTMPASFEGTWDITVALPDGRTTTLANAYTYTTLTLTSVTPNAGPLAAGTVVNLAGTGFAAGASVTIGGVAATACMVVSPASITCTAPAGTAGAKNVVLTQPSGSVTLTGGYTYQAVPTLTSITPNTGPLTAGTAVSLVGSNFAAGASVTIDGTAATACTVVSATSITCTAPAGTAGAKNVVLTQPGGTVTLTNGYTYKAAPTLTSITPAIGRLAAGTAVSLVGTNFVTGATVTIGGAAATLCTVVSATSITCTAPVGTAGAKNVVLTQPGGTVTLTNGYTYQAAPTLTSITPKGGSLAAGTPVSLVGTNFGTGASVTIGGVAATACTVVSATSITCTAPAGTAGAKSIVVTQPGGTVTLTNGYTYTTMTLASVTPNTGPLAAGTAVSLVGTNFVTGATVTIGGTAATTCTRVSATSITCKAPVGTAGAKDVVVTQTGGSVTLVGGYTYQAAPTVTSITPNNGPQAAGTAVSLAGTNFATGASVTIGGTAATACTWVSATSITCTAPAGTAGLKNVVVTQPGGTATLTNGYTYQGTTTDLLTSSVNPTLFGGATTFTVTVTGINPTGLVTFKDGATTLGTGAVTAGVATFTTSALSAGVHSITAVYSGDTNDAISTSNTLTQTVNAGASGITLSSSTNPTSFGINTTLTATLTGLTPSGSVSFKDGVTPLGTGTVTAGVATLVTGALSVGTHSLTAVYAGDTNNASSSSSALTQTVNAALTTRVVNYTYGYGGQLLTRSATGNATTYTRNDLGQALTAVSPEVTYTYTYDADHRVSTINDSRGNKTTTYAYSQGGLLNRVTESDGRVTNFVYDPVGRLTQIWAPSNDNIIFAYDAGGRLLEKLYSNGAQAKYSYNPDNTLSKLVNLTAATLISQHDYTYDGLGNRQSQVERVGASDAGRTYRYVYDQLSRLSAVNDANNAPLASYTYDILNNRTSKSEAGSTLFYNHDIVNQLKEIRSGSPSGTLLTSMQYDDSGNMTSRVDGSVTTTLAYNVLNQLSQVGKTGLPTETYGYDDSGRRVRKTVGVESDYFVYQGDAILAQYSDASGGWATASASYTQGAGIDQPFLRVDGTGTNKQFYHQDGLGSVIAITDQTGVNAATQRFDAWGNAVASSGTPISQYGYTGREPDATGLMYYRARYYSPDVGRFTQSDPIGLNGGINFYSYVGGNPVNLKDPTGLCPVCAAVVVWGLENTSAIGITAAVAAEVASGVPNPVSTGASFAGRAAQTLTHDVYLGMANGKIAYVGITNDIARRQKEWKGTYDLLKISVGQLTKDQARAVEQYIINEYPGLNNIINSIREGRSWYQEAVDWGKSYVNNLNNCTLP
jgi:RHS repeat-associated protein